MVYTKDTQRLAASLPRPTLPSVESFIEALYKVHSVTLSKVSTTTSETAAPGHVNPQAALSKTDCEHIKRMMEACRDLEALASSEALNEIETVATAQDEPRPLLSKTEEEYSRDISEVLRNAEAIFKAVTSDNRALGRLRRNGIETAATSGNNEPGALPCRTEEGITEDILEALKEGKALIRIVCQDMKAYMEVESLRMIEAARASDVAKVQSPGQEKHRPLRKRDRVRNALWETARNAVGPRRPV
jgi:hypothetical protein